MHKTRDCEEIAVLNGNSYKFAATNGFIKRVALKGRDPAYLFDDLSSGLLPPNHISNVLSCALEKKNGLDVTDKHNEVIDQFMEDAGLQESAHVARVLLAHAMIGNVKKKQINQGETITKMELKTKNFLSRSFVKPGLLLAAISSILITLAYTTSSF